MAKLVLEGVATLKRVSGEGAEEFARPAVGERGIVRVGLSERKFPGKHFVEFYYQFHGSLVSERRLRTSCGTLEHPDESMVILRDTMGGHTYEFELDG